MTTVAKRREILPEVFRILAVACCVFLLPVRAVTAQKGQQSAASNYLIERIDLSGNRRVQSAPLFALLSSKPGGPYGAETVLRDAQALRNTGFFDQVCLEVEDSPHQPNVKIVTFHLSERAVIRRIEYRGIRSITEEDILQAYKQQNVRLSVETSFDQTQLSRAAAAIKGLLAAHGYPSASVKPSYERIPQANAVTIDFNVDEGSKAKSL